MSITTGSKIITGETFEDEVLASSKPVLVDFWAEWCGPCRAIAPVLEELAEEYAGRAVIARVNVDEEASLAGVYQIRSIPALLLFRNGKKVDEAIGAVAKEVLVEKLEKALEEK